MTALIPAPPAHDHTTVPIYKLYGYGNVWTSPDPLYCETIAAQEKLHNWHVTAHKHTDLFQILFLQSGDATVVLDGQARALGARPAGSPPAGPGTAERARRSAAGHVVLIPQRVVHEFIFQPGANGYILTLTYALLQPLCQRHGLSLHTLADPALLALDARDDYTSRTFDQLELEYHRPHHPQRGPLLEALLGTILVWVHRHHAPRSEKRVEQPPGGLHLARYAQMIETHFSRQHQVGWYARRLGVTAAHLNIIVQTLAGKTALRLIHERLLLEARRELVYTVRPISAIADSLGFADPAYFTRFFKRLAGLSPKDFRRRMLDGGTAAPDDHTTGS
ncbi:helix-turn-helix domain-containing protein [uncultured Castellaniella sp.]|uniref:helix-turn-helix domain-containing protein n=1 Tax=uncultured Castellaniella sp. TaxID=647907 RepID=UPI00261C3102|nr:helix-turn-helix domain-containing protein [uncultured Castellaniella sp.]